METQISEIKSPSGKKILDIRGIVGAVVQTTGPTLFTVSDGSGTMVIKAFEGPGVRAYPKIQEGDAVKVTMTVKEFNNALEGDAMRFYQLQDKEAEKLKEDIEKQQREIAQAKPIPFMVESQILDKLKDSFVRAATEIRLAIIKNRPLIIRHHNDTDGYSSGYTLERAILPLIQKQHGTGKSLWQYYTRSPSMAPFYEIEDSIKDTASSLSDVAKFSEKLPLVVIVDTGSSEESLLGIKQGKVHGIDFIVVDHHFFQNDVISSEVMVHINPFLVGEDGSKYSAGMLCAELARFINIECTPRIEFIPAMAGMADMIDNPQVMKDYLKLAETKGYTKEMLHEISSVIDYVSTKLRFMEAREYVEVMFGEDLAHQKALIKLMAPYIGKLEAAALKICLSALKKDKVGEMHLQILPIEQTFSRGFYPKPGRCVSIIHDHGIQSEKKLITLGIMSDAITFRASHESNFSIHDFIAYVQGKIPEAFVEGGGHHHAGSIKFIPMKQAEVIACLKDFIGNIK